MMSEMILMVPILILANRIDFTEEQNILYARIGFFTAQTIILSLCAFIYFSIKRENNQKKIKAPPAPEFGKPPVPQSEWPEVTIAEYDMEALQKYVKEFAMQAGIVLFIHYKWEIVPPLFVQTFMNPIKFWKLELFHLHVMGSTSPAYDRPFPEKQNPFAGLAPEPEAEENGERSAPGTIEEIPSEEKPAPKAKPTAKKIKEVIEENVDPQVVAEVIDGKKKVLSVVDDSKITNDKTNEEDLLLLD